MKKSRRAPKKFISWLKTLFRRNPLITIALLLVFIYLFFGTITHIKLNKYAFNFLNLNHRPKISHIEEKITYDVKLGVLHLGQAKFTNTSEVELGGEDLNLVLVETKCAKFTDTERIYSEPKTSLPVLVERDIVNFFSREKITEEYDQKKFTVTITKEKDGKTEKQVIKKDSPIQNSVLLPYYVRRLPQLEVGKVIIANLPTRKLRIKLIRKEKIKVPAGTFEAYYFTSEPKQIKIWLSTDKRRIPLKIEGSGILGYTMLMKEYTP